MVLMLVAVEKLELEEVFESVAEFVVVRRLEVALLELEVH
jgi:hypothetical protein